MPGQMWAGESTPNTGIWHSPPVPFNVIKGFTTPQTNFEKQYYFSSSFCIQNNGFSTSQMGNCVNVFVWAKLENTINCLA